MLEAFLNEDKNKRNKGIITPNGNKISQAFFIKMSTKYEKMNKEALKFYKS